MTFERRLAEVFNLTDENWMKHANPVSVWTRYSVLPLIMLAIWSRIWLGWWSAAPVCLSLVWMFFNPVIFTRPHSTKNWASKAVLGERVYLNRDKISLPSHHDTRFFNLLNALAGVGLVLAIYASITYSFWEAVTGLLLAYLGKSWFLDRMVWLYEDMKRDNEQYQQWEY